MKTLTKIEKKAMCIVLSAGYASGKTPSSVLNIFDEHCKYHGEQGLKNYAWTLSEAYSKALDKLDLYDWSTDNKNYINNKPWKKNDI